MGEEMGHVEDEAIIPGLDEAEGYSLAESRKSINELYPVLVDFHGNIIDGNSRIEAFPSWRREVREDIKSESQLCLARIVANSHRRVVTVGERAEQLEALARSLMKNEGVSKANIIKVLASLTTFSPGYVRGLLSEDFKRFYPSNNEKLDDSNDLVDSKSDNEDGSYSTPHEMTPSHNTDTNHIHRDLHNRRLSLQISKDPEEDTVDSDTDLSPSKDGSLAKLEIVVDQREPEWVCRERAMRRIRRAFDDQSDPDFDYLSWEASILDGVSFDEALDLIDQVMKEKNPEHAPSKNLGVDRVVTCPLCNREGASSSLIIKRARDPKHAQSSLMEFIEEACILDEPY
jgi:hypothetical protein